MEQNANVSRDQNAGPLSLFSAARTVFQTNFKTEPRIPRIPSRLIEQAKKDINLDKLNFCNIAFVGTAGSGKSSVLNAILGYEDGSEGAAEVGEVETTRKPKHFLHPDIRLAMFWDMPGVGTPDHPMDTYFEKNHLRNFDLLVIVLGNRLMQHDIDIAKKAEGYGIPVLFVRSKADQAIESKVSRNEEGKTYTYENAVDELVKEIKNSVLKQLDKVKEIFIIDSIKLYQFVDKINKPVEVESLSLIDEKRLVTALVERVVKKRKAITRKQKKQRAIKWLKRLFFMKV